MLQPIKSGFHDFKATWAQLLLVGFATRTALAVAIFPGIALLLRFLLSTTGRGVLRDEEILDFFLTLPGFVTLLLIGGFWIGAALIEQAALMTIGLGASDSRRVYWFKALQLVASRLHAILMLGSHLLARALIIAVPFVITAFVIYKKFLGSHDINYYLNEHPPEFIRAAIVVGLLMAAMVALLARKISSWFLALPILMFENVRPPAAIKKSTVASDGHRIEFLGWFFGWLALSTLASIFITSAIGFVGRLIVSASIDSLGLVAFTIGSVGVLSIIANGLISIFAASLFALIIVHLYQKYSGLGTLPEKWVLDHHPTAQRAAGPSLKVVLLGFAASLGLALLAMWFMVSNMRMEDDVLIIAHRGSAATAPENTMAAIHDALDADSDMVEIDVQETADGQVVVFHDSDFMKTARQSLKIWDAKRPDLDRIDIGSWFDPKFSSERTPTLTDVLLASKGRSRVDIELKYYGHDRNLERKVIESVEAADMADEVVVMSLKYDKVSKIKAMRPDWTYGLLTTVSLGDISRFDVDFLGVSASSASRSFIRRAHSCGLKVYVWTVNDPFQMSAMMSRGADGIITDDPALAKRVLKLRAELNPVERLLIGIGTEVGVFTIPDVRLVEDDA